MRRVVIVLIMISLLISTSCNPISEAHQDYTAADVQEIKINPEEPDTSEIDASKIEIPEQKQVEPSKLEEPDKNQIVTGKGQKSADQQSELNISEKPIDESTRIVGLIDAYIVDFVKAVNNNDFSLIEPYLVAGSSFYDTQKKLVQDLASKGIKEKYVSHEIGFIYKDSEGSDTSRVEVVESIHIINPEKGESTEEFQRIYTVNYLGNEYKISNIEKWTTFEADILQRSQSAKPDEFYIYPFFENYDADLVYLLNGEDGKTLDGLFQNEEVKTAHNALIEELKSKGKEFRGVKTEYLQHWSNSKNPYVVTKKILLSYVDENSNTNEIELYLTLIAEFYRPKSRLSFSGYIRITDIQYTLEESKL